MQKIYIQISTTPTSTIKTLSINSLLIFILINSSVITATSAAAKNVNSDDATKLKIISEYKRAEWRLGSEENPNDSIKFKININKYEQWQKRQLLRDLKLHKSQDDYEKANPVGEEVN